jgi:hypothetical protein
MMPIFVESKLALVEKKHQVKEAKWEKLRQAKERKLALNEIKAKGETEKVRDEGRC